VDHLPAVRGLAVAGAHALAANAPASMVPSGSALRALTLQLSEPAPPTPGLPGLWQGLAQLTQLTQLRLEPTLGGACLAPDASAACLAAVRALSGLRSLTLSNLRASCQQLQQAAAGMTQLTCLQLDGVQVVDSWDMQSGSLPASLVELELPNECYLHMSAEEGPLPPQLRHLKTDDFHPLMLGGQTIM